MQNAQKTMTWLQRIVQARSDLTTNPGGLDDGGANVSGPLFPGQAQLFIEPEKGKKNVRKKKLTRQYNRRGVEDVTAMP